MYTKARHSLPKPTKLRKVQEDRLLKQLPLGERRQQEMLRRAIVEERHYYAVI